MANLVLFGVPYGFRTSKCKNEDAEFLGLFYAPNKPGTYLKGLRRSDNTIHYVVNGMNTIMQQNPELNLGKYIQPLSSLPPQQKNSRV